MDVAKNKQDTAAHRIDVHHHILPPTYVSSLGKKGTTGTPGVAFPKWSPEISLKLMDKYNFAAAITSISSPGVYFGNPAFARDLARQCNDFSAQLVSDHPDRFGALAVLPLPDVDGALTELEYALDTLKLDGVVMLSNVEGVYPGDRSYNEVFAELDRRGTVVFIHPNDPPWDSGTNPALFPLLEWPVDTFRAVTNLLHTGMLERYPNIRYYLAHGGGSIPYLAWRVAAGALAEANDTAFDRGSFDYTGRESEIGKNIDLLKNLYYDLAQPGDALAKSVQELADHTHILLGTDFPQTMDIVVGLTMKALDGYNGLQGDILISVERNNALGLFPRFGN